ncbi:MAG: hypothetical protein ACLGHP_03890, partial [Vicinamibacteria bacterium]
MTDDVEALLARYRPSGPPPGLRDRVVAPRPWTWPWVAAAAALLLATGVGVGPFHALATYLADTGFGRRVTLYWGLRLEE